MLDRALTVAAAKAKTLGLGLVVAGTALGATFAVPALSPVDSESPAPEQGVVVEATPEQTAATEPTAGTGTTDSPAATDAAEEAPDAEPTRTPLPCPSDVRNHGEYVSLVARDKSVTGRQHGRAVSEAAHSDCGKSADEADAEPAETESPSDEPRRGKGHEKKHGKGHAKHGD